MKIIPIVAIIATIVVVSTTIPAAYAQDATVESTATILAVCGAATVPLTIDYGILAPNQESADESLAISNTGNTDASMSLSGTDWNTATITSAMLVSATHYSLTAGVEYDDKTALSGTPAEVTTLGPLGSADTFWQLRAVLNDPAATGLALQTVTVSATC